MNGQEKASFPTVCVFSAVSYDQNPHSVFKNVTQHLLQVPAHRARQHDDDSPWPLLCVCVYFVRVIALSTAPPFAYLTVI